MADLADNSTSDLASSQTRNRQPYFGNPLCTPPCHPETVSPSPTPLELNGNCDSPPALEDSTCSCESVENLVKSVPIIGQSPRKEGNRRVSWNSSPQTPPQKWLPSSVASPARPPFCTPPHSPPRKTTTHDPYKLKTPSPHRNIRNVQLTRYSPKARTPTRTRLAVELQNSSLNTSLNNSSNSLSTSLSPLQSQNFSLTASLAGTPLHAQATPFGTPGLQPTAYQLLMGTPPGSQCSAASRTANDSLPPSLQQFLPTPSSQMNLFSQFDQLSISENPLQVLSQIQGLPQFLPSTTPSMPMLSHGMSYPLNPQFPSLPFPFPPMMLPNGYSSQLQQQTQPHQWSQCGSTTVAAPASAPSSGNTSPVPPASAATASGQRSNRRIYVLGEFKRGRTVQFESPFMPQLGEFLICEGDYGEDLGMCVHVWVGSPSSTPLVNNSLAANRNCAGKDRDPVTGEQIFPRVIRQAFPEEVQALHGAQAQAETKCVQIAKHKVLEAGLPMTVVDAEYQFDKKKLTFYYETAEEQRIDFRELIRDLYKIYRARIWMSRVRHAEDPTPAESKVANKKQVINQNNYNHNKTRW